MYFRKNDNNLKVVKKKCRKVSVNLKHLPFIYIINQFFLTFYLTYWIFVVYLHSKQRGIEQ